MAIIVNPGYRGFTLVELLVVVAIALIIAQAAIPGFSGLLKDNQNTTRINDLNYALALAHSEAITRDSTVILCKTSDGRSCDESGTDWDKQWMVFEDLNDNGDLDAANNEPVLRLFESGPEDQTLKFAPARVSYDGSGIATDGAGSTFVLCDDRGAAHAKGLIINAIGRIRQADDSDRSGIVEDANGEDVDCS